MTRHRRRGIIQYHINRANTNESPLSFPLWLHPFFLCLSASFHLSWEGRISLYQNKWVFVKILHLCVITGNQRNSYVFCQGPDSNHVDQLSFFSLVTTSRLLHFTGNVTRDIVHINLHLSVLKHCYITGISFSNYSNFVFTF